jgi:hypothetical protein
MTDTTSRTKAEKIDAKLSEERDRLAAALRRLADRIEGMPLDRVSGGLAWIATAVEALAQRVERAFHRDQPSQPRPSASASHGASQGPSHGPTPDPGPGPDPSRGSSQDASEGPRPS